MPNHRALSPPVNPSVPPPLSPTLFRPFPVNHWVLLSARLREFESKFSGPREEPSRTGAFRVNRESAPTIAAITKQGEMLATSRAAGRSRSRRHSLTAVAARFEATLKAPRAEPSSNFLGERVWRQLRKNAGGKSSSPSRWGVASWTVSNLGVRA